MSGDLLGKYRLGDRIARGGMAEIYHAQVVGASGFAREIVVKRILPDLVEDDEFREMFKDEAKLAAVLEHPNIVQIFDFDQVGDSFYIAMEYIRGADLAKLIRAAAERSERLPPETIVFVVSEILEGLRYAHNLPDEDGHPLGVIHRDISPANILLSYAGAVKLADFGIAKAATSMVRTSAGILKGKYPYMSPEQAAGKQLDKPSDLFSVGIVLYQACTGRRPFRGRDSVELLEKVMRSEYPPPRRIHPSLPMGLEAVISKALRADPDARYQDASEFIADLRTALPEPPNRDDLERCLKRLIPEKPRTLSGAKPGAPLAESIGTPSKVSVDLDISPYDPTTAGPDALPTAPSRSAKRKKAMRLIAAAAVLGLVGLGLGAWLVGAGPLRPHVAPQADSGAAEVPRGTFTVLARLSPDQELELRRHGLDEALAERNLKLRLLRYEQYDDLFTRLRNAQVDLANVPLAAAKALAVEDLIVPVGRIAEARLVEVASRFTASGVEVATVDMALGSGMAYLPGMLEVHLIAYRISKVELARARWAEHREPIEEALRAVNGRGLPEGYDLEADPSEWDEFDLFVAGYTWAHADEDGVVPAPRLALRSESYWPSVEALLDWAARMGENRVSWSRRQPLLDVLTWLCMHREHGLQRLEVWETNPSGRSNGTSISRWFAQGDIYAMRVNQFRVSELASQLSRGRAGFDMTDVGLAHLPTGVSLQLDEAGTPLRQGRHDGLINSWLWAVPASTSDAQRSMEVALELTTPQVQSYFANRNCWIPTLQEAVPTSASSGIAPHCRRAIAPALERLERPLVVGHLPAVARLTQTISQFEALWGELLVDHGYRGEESPFEQARFDAITARHLPQR